jgi:rubrerythrin
MILEPISGFNGKDYLFEISMGERITDVLEQALLMEENAYRFYTSAADQMVIREVERLMRHMAQENARHRDKLKALNPPD